MRKFYYLFIPLFFLSVVFSRHSFAQSENQEEKEAKPLPFWVETLPKVMGNLEKQYDINGDGILQTSETKVLLRHVSAEVQANNSYNVVDSKLLKIYDKNKDGIISKLELMTITADLDY